MRKPCRISENLNTAAITILWLLLAVIAYPPPVNGLLSVQIGRTKINPLTKEPCLRRRHFSHAYLFNGGKDICVLDDNETAIKSRNSFNKGRITKEVMEDLQNGVQLPYDFEYFESLGSPKKRSIRLKQLEKDEISKAVSLCLKEYGSYPSTNTLLTNEDEISTTLKNIMNDLDNFMFSFVVLLGLDQRVERRKKSDIDRTIPPDHNVICIHEVDEEDKETMIGMAEISLQPADPARTSPPFVLPTGIKNAFVSFGLWTEPVPYISNVLVTNDYRGKGFSKVLMACCEGLAKAWGYDEAYLHVDADRRSGAPAQGLYHSLGYIPVMDEKYNEKFAWMGIDTVNKGLYIVDGVALLFLKKKLK